MDLAYPNVIPQRPSFWIRLNQVDYPLMLINDVSPTHIDVSVPVRLSRNTTTNLVFQDEDIVLKLKIKVISCAKDPQADTWQLRLGFYNEYHEQNTLCFMALRKYLNRFDAQSYKDSSH